MFTGTGFAIQNSQIPYCQKEFGQGEIVMLERHEERTLNSHRAFFAFVNEAWKNLPEGLEQEYPTPAHLRKKLLIRLGWFDERSIVCDTERDAAVIGAYLAPIHETGIIVISGNVIKIYTAKSQSYAAMSKRNFEESKRAVVDALANLIQTSVREIETSARNDEGDADALHHHGQLLLTGPESEPQDDNS